VSIAYSQAYHNSLDIFCSLAASIQVDRAHYTPSSPYQDRPQAIGYGATISAPHMHAMAIEHLLSSVVPSESQPAPRVLDIGSGSGYLTHLLAELVGDKGKVVGLEHISALRELGEKNMAKSEDGRAFLASGRAVFREGDGRQGWKEPEKAKPPKASATEPQSEGWDAIHVGASAVELHQQLVDQLRRPGRMFIPVNEENGNGDQWIWTVDKDKDGNVTKKRVCSVRYVPLTDAPAM
jgi:protein-L-isoaspartate(D-aspartate) O-methyltransferase